MFELTINGEVYSFNAGMGFLREVNKRYSQPVDGIPGAKQNVGLSLMVAGIMDGDVESLVDALEAANKGCNPRITRAGLDAYIDNECEDIDALFESVLDFLRNSNATKKVVSNLQERVEKAKADAEAKK